MKKVHLQSSLVDRPNAWCRQGRGYQNPQTTRDGTLVTCAVCLKEIKVRGDEIMPYIEKKERAAYKEHIDEIVKLLFDNDHPGHVNYVISKILRSFYTSESRYRDYNEAMGVLSCVQQEFYRRYIALYEDQKIYENGDI